MAPTNRLTHLNGAPEPSWDEDLAQTAKAVRDSILEELPSHAVKALGPTLRELETSLAAVLGRTLEKEVSRALRPLEKRLGDLEKTCGGLEKNLGNLEGVVAGLEKSCDALPSLLKTILSGLPIPKVEVTLPEKSIHVDVSAQKAPEVTVNVPKQEKPEVTVNLPEGAIRVEVDQKPSVVNLPEGVIKVRVDAPTIEVNVPKQETPQVDVHVAAPEVNVAAPGVTVNVPKQEKPEVNVRVDAPDVKVEIPRRKVKKTILYDDLGRPTEIVEEEI